MSYDSEELQALRLRVAELADMVESCELDIYNKAGRQTLIDSLWKAAHVDSDLAKMYVKARRLNGDNAEEVEDRARELAISFIVSGGFDCDDSDLGGDPMGDTVQTHLMIAFMRQPSMMRHHEEAMVEGGDKGEFGDREEEAASPCGTAWFLVHDRVKERVRYDRRLTQPIDAIGVVTQVDSVGNLLVRWPGDRTPKVMSANDVSLVKRPSIIDHKYDAGYPRDDSKGCIETIVIEGGVETTCGQPEDEHAASEYSIITIKPKELRREFANLFLVCGRRYKVTYSRPTDVGSTVELIGIYDKEDGDRLLFKSGSEFVPIYKFWIRDITDVD